MRIRVSTIILLALLALSIGLCSSCVIVVDDTPAESREGTQVIVEYSDTDESCDEVPHEHRAQRCDVYEGRDCCEWYIGDGCFEKYCFYYHNCEWHWYGTTCEVQE